MLFKQIKYFLTIADSGSFSEAAAQCYISQSAVSQQINALENELGVRLLERLPRGIVLTDAGSFLYEHGRKLVADAQKLKQGILTAAYKLNERLSVAYITGSVPEFLPQALCVFKSSTQMWLLMFTVQDTLPHLPILPQERQTLWWQDAACLPVTMMSVFFTALHITRQ